MTTKQGGTQDYVFSRNLALILIIFFLFSACIGLNRWPYQTFFHDLNQLTIVSVFTVFKNISIIILLFFWGAKPSLRARQFVVVSGLLILVYSAFHFEIRNPFSWLIQNGIEGLFNLVSIFSIPASINLLLRIIKISRSDPKNNFDQNLINLFFTVALFVAYPHNALELITLFNPLVFDAYSMRWDAISSLNVTPTLFKFVDGQPWLSTLVNLAYVFTPIGFLCVAMKQLSGYPVHVASGAKTWLVISGLACVAYSFFPITGPIYIFGTEHFVQSLINWAQFPLQLYAGTIAPRNGMPSMHFGWMLVSSILWWRSGSAWWSRSLFIIATGLTATATIFRGEHYVVDLIVAVPFSLATVALCTNTVKWSYPEKKWSVIGGFLTWLIWIIVLRNLVPFAQNHPWLCWAMNCMTLLVVIFQCVALKRFASLAEMPVDRVKPLSDVKVGLFTTFESKIGAMFFASGTAALIYQVLFAKKLALTFGSTSTATMTVLATFLGGMAIGSFVGGKFASKTKHPLLSYAVIEGLIAIYCIATPTLFNFVQTLYINLSLGLPPEAPTLLVLRICLGATVLLVPTMLMGATLPLLAQVLQTETQRLGSKIALLYLVNTAGATVGSLLCSYILIPSIGVASTTLVAAMLNLLVALGGLELNKKFKFTPAHGSATDRVKEPNLFDKSIPTALTTLFVGGVLSLGLEVVYVHMLCIVAGNSVYAFGLMLATFLSGLSIGGFISKEILTSKTNNLLRCLAYCFLGLTLCTSVSIYFWNTVPDYFASFAGFSAARTFNAREAIRAVVCGLIMLPPTIFIGAAYVFGMDIITHHARNNQIRMLGLGATLNTIGNIAGVLLFGFYLLPLLGGLSSTLLISFISSMLAVMIFFLNQNARKKVDALAVCLTIFFGVLFFRTPLNYESLSSGANVYFQPQSYGSVIDHTESIDGGLTSVTQAANMNFKTLLTNGKFQGNNAWEGEMQAQLGFAIAPLLHQEKRDRALVLGYGTGVTSRVLSDAGFRELDIAELSKDIITMANKHFSEVNQQVTKHEHVNLHITDGRNMLLLAPKSRQYDLVSIEITSIWFAGAASLYNQEFYQLVKTHLQPDGVLQQWIQIHHLNPTDILSIISTLRSEFKYVSLYIIGGQGILIATNDINHKDANAVAINAVNQNNTLLDTLHRGKQSADVVQKSLLLDNGNIDRYIAKFETEPGLWVSNDDNLRLEYSTPKGNVNDYAASYRRNLQILKQFQQPQIPTP